MAYHEYRFGMKVKLIEMKTGPMPWLHQSGLDRILFRKINQDRDKYLAFSRKQVGQRTQSDVWKSDRKDFFYYLLNSKDPETGQGFGKAELWGESNTLIIAGEFRSPSSQGRRHLRINEMHRLRYHLHDPHRSHFLPPPQPLLAGTPHY